MQNLDSEVQLRRQDNMRQEERVGELSAIIGVHEEVTSFCIYLFFFSNHLFNSASQRKTTKRRSSS